MVPSYTTPYNNHHYFTKSKLHKLLQRLPELLLNTSYNITDIYQYIYIKMENNSFNNDNSSASTSTEFNSLEAFAKNYRQNYHFYLSITICVFGTVANVLNIIVLTRKDMACAPINRILTALAVADMLVMIEYIPYVYYYLLVVPKRMDFPYSGAVFMLFHALFTQILHTISICLTLMLAIWRYLAIGYPEKNHYLCSQSRCTLGIILSYYLPLILCAPIYATMTIKSDEIIENNKTFILYHVDIADKVKKNKIIWKLYFLVYAIFIKILPCCILTVITCWLIRTLFKAKKRKQVLRECNAFPLTMRKDMKVITTKAERRADRTTKMLIAVLFLFIVTEFPQGLFAFVISIKGQELYQVTYQAFGEILDILALTNGAINFILYCYMNRMFRSTFGQLFKNTILRQRMASAPASDIHTTPVSNGTISTEL